MWAVSRGNGFCATYFGTMRSACQLCHCVNTLLCKALLERVDVVGHCLDSGAREALENELIIDYDVTPACVVVFLLGTGRNSGNVKSRH